MNQLSLATDIGAYTHDPYGFVLYAFPWGVESTPLANKSGPRNWQAEELKYIGTQLSKGHLTHYEAIRMAIASGHGVGKSAFISFLVLWAMSTLIDTRGVVTANTDTQLKTKTWAELSKWFNLCITAPWFDLEATSISSRLPGHKRTWRIDSIPWSPHNPEAFAGLHNEGKRTILLFDEASAIDDIIWETSLGALTDANTEMIFAVLGNPTRNTGGFRRCFGSLQHRWHTRQIDSRDVDGTNLTELQNIITDYGEDSDIARVRVRGMFPKASSIQFIPHDVALQASLIPARSNRDDPLLMTLDIARGGDDNCVFAFRRGLDARSIPMIVIPGSEARDSMHLVSIATELLVKHKPDMFFYDGTGVGGPVGDRIKQLGYPVYEVQFSRKSPDPHCGNLASYMWRKGLTWLEQGGAIPNDQALIDELTNRDFDHNKRDQLILEPKDRMKKRTGLASPDRADALFLSFAAPVAPRSGISRNQSRGTIKADYNPIGRDRW